MKIGMVLDQVFPPDIRVENEALSLTKAGHEVFILCYAKKGDKNFIENYKGITLVKISIPLRIAKKLRALTNTIINIYPHIWSGKIAKLIKEFKIDILHVHDLYMLGAAYLTNREFNLPVIADLHENYTEGIKNYKWSNSFFGKLLISQKKWQQTEIEWCGKADHILTVIEEAKERYKDLGINEEKISVVANYVDELEFITPEIPEVINRFKNFFNVSYIGGFDKHRGIECVLDAIPLVINKIKNFRLILVGTGINETELRKRVRTLKIESYISFEGYQPPSTLSSYIKASEICLIPHIKTIHTDNTIPHKLFQYMVMARPVIATDCNPLKRIVEESNCGLIYQSGNAIQLAENIVKLHANPGLREKMGSAGNNAVKEKYNWQVTQKNLINLYTNYENSCN